MSILKYREVGTTEWTLLKDPRTLQWDISDIDADTSGRGQDGKMFRDRIDSKRKLTCSWGPLTDSEISSLITLFTAVFFQLEYPDAQTGTRLVKTFYVGDRSAPMYYYNAANDSWEWESLSANFIEQ